MNLINMSWVIYSYFLIGLIFGIWFIIAGASILDKEMRTANWRVKLLLLPGAAGLWCWLLIKMIKLKKNGTRP